MAASLGRRPQLLAGILRRDTVFCKTGFPANAHLSFQHSHVKTGHVHILLPQAELFKNRNAKGRLTQYVAPNMNF